MAQIYFESEISYSLVGFFVATFFVVAIVLIQKLPAFGVRVAKVIPVPERVLVFTLALLSLVIAVGKIVQYHKYSDVADLVHGGKVHSIAGCIADYVTEKINSREESFKIKGVHFRYNDVATSKWFFANRNFGDGFIANGRCLDLSYIEIGSHKYIVKIREQS